MTSAWACKTKAESRLAGTAAKLRKAYEAWQELLGEGLSDECRPIQISGTDTSWCGNCPAAHLMLVPVSDRYSSATLFAMSAHRSAPYAHTLRGLPGTEWEPLNVHLQEVADLAEQYAAAWGSAGWGSVLGQCHDLGKASAAFQAKLRAANPQEAEDAGEQDQAASQRVDHSTFGARYKACF